MPPTAAAEVTPAAMLVEAVATEVRNVLLAQLRLRFLIATACLGACEASGNGGIRCSRDIIVHGRVHMRLLFSLVALFVSLFPRLRCIGSDLNRQR